MSRHALVQLYSLYYDLFKCLLYLDMLYGNFDIRCGHTWSMFGFELVTWKIWDNFVFR